MALPTTRMIQRQRPRQHQSWSYPLGIAPHSGPKRGPFSGNVLLFSVGTGGHTLSPLEFPSSLHRSSMALSSTIRLPYAIPVSQSLKTLSNMLIFTQQPCRLVSCKYMWDHLQPTTRCTISSVGFQLVLV